MLVAAPERWDEACFAVPALRALRASGLEVGVICREEQKAFWKTLPGLGVLAFPSNTGPKLAAAGIRGNWQAALVWEAGFAADTVKIAAVPRRLGPDGRNLKKLLTHPLSFAGKPLEHRVRFFLSAIEEIGINTLNPEFFAPVAPISEPLTNSVLLAPDSDFGASHEWPLDRWQEIARKLLDSGHKVTIAFVDGGRGLGKRLALEIGGDIGVLQASSLSVALPLLAGYRWIVAADGSLPHVAAHLGATCVTLFGPDDPQWRRPLGRRHSVVRRHVECAPCLLAKCPLDLRCQIELETTRVWAAVREKLGVTEPPECG
jgi:ADP-heptose:LPS heptosyltransferase